MSQKNKYNTPEAFRKALESRLMTEAKAGGRDISTLRKKAAFDAFLSRVGTSGYPMALKGGYAMELRLKTAARPTKDIDLVARSAAAFQLAPSDPALSIAMALDEIAIIDLGDYFQFRISRDPKELRASGDGSWRFYIESLIGPRRFEKFHLDVALGDAWMTPMDRLKLSSFEFAGVAPVELNVINVEQHYAEKLHALTVDRGNAINSRVKDLLDMAMFVSGGLEPESAAIAVHEVFTHRGTHNPPKEITDPHESWERQYNDLASKCGFEPSFSEALRMVRTFHDEMMQFIPR